MTSHRMLNVVGVHTAGEVCDVIIGGVLDVPGETMYDKMMHFWKKRDSLRQVLLNEPRGCAAMCTNLILAPCNREADAGFIIMEHEEYPPMSGANTIATATVLLESGMIPIQGPTTHLKLDTPAGLVAVDAKCEGGKCKAVSFTNVPAFVFALDREIVVPDLGKIKVDIAWGGMFYVLVDAASVGLQIESKVGAKLVEVGERIKRAVQDQTHPVHPENTKIQGVTVLEFTGPMSDEKFGKASINTVVVSPGRLDRSPCGTGTCARLAVLHARGLLAEDEPLYHRSIVGSEFVGSIRGKTTVGEFPAVIPVVKGSAWVTSYKQVVLDPTDPFPKGFRVGDLWQM
ncbi:proline racemase [Polychaeton citri CBS 116435]|uniref:Proline racemase n=1 Tax=Polychaeton citri CBS 116435 TaxID=1314669 RepID=A0A9P4USY2_9PEZI|nr:proline racemase [Polychaeton citri CBS 116435]